MQTDYPTTTIYFVFAFTFCKVKVYTAEEPFLRKLLGMNERVELDLGDRGDDHYTEIDTRVLTAIIQGSLKRMLDQFEMIHQGIEEMNRMLNPGS